MTELAAIQDIKEINAESIVIPQALAEGLNSWQIRTMKDTIATVQGGTIVVGHTLRVMAKSLHQLKSLIPRGSWVRFTESNIVPLSGRQIRDHVIAYEGFLSKSDLSDGQLATISARSLAKLASADTAVKKAVTKKLKAGEVVTEKMITAIKNNIDSVVEDADDDSWLQKMGELQVIAEDVVTNNERFRMENHALERKLEKLETENARLKKQIADLKAELEDRPAKVITKVASKAKEMVEL